MANRMIKIMIRAKAIFAESRSLSSDGKSSVGITVAISLVSSWMIKFSVSSIFLSTTSSFISSTGTSTSYSLSETSFATPIILALISKAESRPASEALAVR